jgi:hypothetical protein
VSYQATSSQTTTPTRTTMAATATKAEGAPQGRINAKLRYGDGTPGACLHPSDPLVASWSSLPAFLFFIWPEYRVRRRGRSTELWPTLG